VNVNWLFNLPAPVRRGLYFGLQRAMGSGIASAWREMQRWERFTPAKVEAGVEARLGETIDRAVRDSEYYRGLRITRRPGEPAREALKRFPLLDREILREHFPRIVADPLRRELTSPESVCPRRYGWVVVKTGGTTGNPTTVVHDATSRDWGRATRLLAAKMCGHPLGVRYFRLWGSEPDLLHEQANIKLRVLFNLVGALPLNAFRAKEAELLRHHATILAHPEIDSMMAYVDAAAGLAEFIEQRNLDRPKLRTIMACAGTVTPEWRELLQRVFQAEVFDKYGSRDCCDMACECSAHEGLHVFSPHCYLEIVDDLGQPCAPGVTGRILVTLLNNHGFPMIRYQVGDLGQWAAPGACPCGLAWPKIKSLQGRADDMLTTEDGTQVSSVFVRHFVGVSLNRQIIREWQLEQTGPRHFVFRYIPTTQEGLAANLEKIVESFKLAFGRSVTITPACVKEIPPSPTGKIRWIINTYRKCPGP
jgi:phenylacetate-CoA ligase